VGHTPGRVGPGADRLAGQALRQFDPSLGCHTSTQGGEGRVGGGRSTQLAGHVGWPPGLHLVPDLSKLVEVPFTLINTTLTVKVHTPHST
jgi:hypothetical protein